MATLRKYICTATQKYSVDYDEDLDLFVWADPDDPDNVLDVLDCAGWTLVPGCELIGTDEYEDFFGEEENGFVELPESE